MSHVCSIEIEIKSLEALKLACKRLGCELVEGQKQYKWWGRSVGDYPLPVGFSKNELGTCEHAIRVTKEAGGHDRTYEVGVVQRRDGKSGYTLLWDFYAGGQGLQAAIGQNGGKLKQAYAVEMTKLQARKQGFRVQEKTVNGQIKILLSK